VSSVRYELGFYISEGEILHSHRRENLNRWYISTELHGGKPTWGIAEKRDINRDEVH
jgi:hypothetical protein